MTKPDGERIAVLEANHAHLAGKLDHLTELVEAQSRQIAKLNSYLENARGARWAIIVFATLGGGLGTVGLGKIATVLNFFATK